ncbi:DUF4440 domain-containing protein [Desulfobotulus sp. H1]|uniref:DUF4440 domain-containing protein n=1 Tax=Desulfobotulus pelophilus TaxID=2823377 RepID=A0ABT3N5G5_9BACT|nr:nuclear transport factor 2 family protein [Desulfobotulus pelophilus]MCW7752703.1 DUF4440 domain-containing protein [Desulfobotulus pelophilus]
MRFLSVLMLSALVMTGCTLHPQPSTPTDGIRYEICQTISETEIADLFQRWNESLTSGNPSIVTALYAKNSILLPTLSNQPRLSVSEKEDYFRHFMEKRPKGNIDQRHIIPGCNMALDAGLYTFTFAATGEQASGRYSFLYRWDGTDWRIISHHSSLMPE